MLRLRTRKAHDTKGSQMGARPAPTCCCRLRRVPAYDRALLELRTWLDSWPGVGHVAVGMHRQGYDLQLTQVRRPWLARDVLRGKFYGLMRGGA